MNHRFSVAVGIVLLTSSGVSLAADDGMFGVAASDGKSACVAFPAMKEPRPRLVRIVMPDAPQRALYGTLGAKLDQPCAAILNGQLDGPYFALQITSIDALQSSWIGIVLLSPPWAVRNRGSHVLAIRAPLKGVAFRACTSSEGLHLTVWAGAPIKGRRLWHEYYYLGYDVEPTCTREDYE